MEFTILDQYGDDENNVTFSQGLRRAVGLWEVVINRAGRPRKEYRSRDFVKMQGLYMTVSKELAEQGVKLGEF